MKEPAPPALLRAGVPRFIVDVARRFGGTLDLEQTLQQVVRAVVEMLDFDVAVLSLQTVEGDYEVVQVAGPESVRRTLLGTRKPRQDLELLLKASTPLGTSLCFLDHKTDWPVEMANWVPDLPLSDDPNAWHHDDALFAPLVGTEGELLGVLSVDCPVSGMRPDAHQIELLELFAVQASLALDHARLHNRLERSESLLRQTFRRVPVGLAVFGPDQRLEQANQAYCDFLGRTEDQLIGHFVREFSHPDDFFTTEQMSRKIRNGSAEVLTQEKRYVRADGEVVWGQVTLTAIVDSDGNRSVLAQLEDVTNARQVAADLERRAATDDLTGLSNRATILSYLEECLEGPGLTGVLYCDLDLFKEVNDTLGHATGDELLVQVAKNLRSVMRPTDRAGRFGGDEFVLVLRDVRQQGDAMAIAERIRKSSRRTVVLGARSVPTSMTIGVAVVQSGADPHQTLAAADRALYAAKQAGRNRVQLA